MLSISGGSSSARSSRSSWSPAVQDPGRRTPRPRIGTEGSGDGGPLSPLMRELPASPLGDCLLAGRHAARLWGIITQRRRPRRECGARKVGAASVQSKFAVQCRSGPLRMFANVIGMRMSRPRHAVALLWGSSHWRPVAPTHKPPPSPRRPSSWRRSGIRRRTRTGPHAADQRRACRPGRLGFCGGSLGAPGTARTGSSANWTSRVSLIRRNNNATGEPPEPAIPVLKPEDWIVVEVDFHLAARGAPTPGACQTRLRAGRAQRPGRRAGSDAIPCRIRQ